jgi:hypothetical protein
MTDNKNLPAFPDTRRAAEQSFSNQNPDQWPTGLTKREWMAAHINVANEVENSSLAFIAELMGKQPPTGTMENHAYWNEAEAKLRVMKADAILAELSKS